MYRSVRMCLLLSFLGCNGRDRPNVIGWDGVQNRPGVGTGPCVPGGVYSCAIELGTHDGVIDCMKGSQTCDSHGVLGPCVANGSRTKVLAPSPSLPSGGGPMAHARVVGGDATKCADNPCNPYCHDFDDTPDASITADASITSTTGTITLADSNIPPGFQSKGSLDGRCVTPCDTQLCMEACQFDQHCGMKTSTTPGCVAFGPTEKDACAGLDITVPPVCSDDGNVTRNITVCNRGSSALTSPIQCFTFPGNKPQFPNATPGPGNWVLTTNQSSSSPLVAGTCKTYKVPGARFASNGTQSLICNPVDGTNVVTIESFPFSHSATPGWTNPDAAMFGPDSLFATVTPSLPGATTTIANVTASKTDPATCWFGCTSFTIVPSSSTEFAALAAIDSSTLSVALPAWTTAEAVVSGFDFGSPPSTAVVARATLNATWNLTTSQVNGEVDVITAAGGFGGSVAAVGPFRGTSSSRLLGLEGMPVSALAGIQAWNYAWRAGSGGGSMLAEIDAVSIDIDWYTASPTAIDYGDFGLAIPAGTTIVSWSIETMLSASTGASLTTPKPMLGFQAFVSGAPLGPYVSTGWMPPLFPTIYSQSGSVSGLTPASFADGTFSVRVGAYRPWGAPDFVGSVDYVQATVQYTGPMTGNVPECNPHNNWSVTKANPAIACEPATVTTYPPFTVTRVFDGVCPSGSRPKWQSFGYSSSTPAGTSIEFRFRTFARTGASCVALPAAISDPPAPLAIASLGPPDTSVCSLSAAPTATCPVDLASGLGSPSSSNDCLQMDARGIPASSPAASPKLDEWRVRYDCIPLE